MHLVDIAGLRPGVFARGLDRAWIQSTEIPGLLHATETTCLHRAGAAFFQWRVVEEGIRPRAQDFRRERRWTGEVACNDFDIATFQSAQQRQPAIHVHRFAQAVVHGLRDQRMVGHFALADDVLQARHLVGEHGRHQVFGLHPLQLRRNFLAANKAR
ncbi:MAG: hypothetical protein ABIP61_04820 [Burkholderiaceae bacterium]